MNLLRGLDKYGCATALIPADPTASPAFAGIWIGKGGCMCGGQVMTYKSVKHGLPRSFTRVWVMTDTGRETTGYVKSDGEWFINCARIRATGAKVLRWKEG